MTTTKRADIYQTVTNAIMTAIEQGQTAEKFTLPWNGFHTMPINAHTRNIYRGINIPMLWVSQLQNGFDSGYWATFRQWKEMGVHVRKGMKGTPVVFWKTVEVEPTEDNEEQEVRMFARWSVVFNADQVEGFAIPKAESTGAAEVIAGVESFVMQTGATVQRGGERAFYDYSGDYIRIPEMRLFHDTESSSATEAYYSTLLHELTHWTGAESRLDRKRGKRFGDADYAFEELVAELGAAMLCAMLGITAAPRDDHAQYIDGWLKALKSDTRFIFSAASQAQKAADFLLALQPSAEIV